MAFIVLLIFTSMLPCTLLFSFVFSGIIRHLYILCFAPPFRDTYDTSSDLSSDLWMIFLIPDFR
jgi:hypothetical protein